jgi:hypothetical protein
LWENQEETWTCFILNEIELSTYYFCDYLFESKKYSCKGYIFKKLFSIYSSNRTYDEYCNENKYWVVTKHAHNLALVYLLVYQRQFILMYSLLRVNMIYSREHLLPKKGKMNGPQKPIILEKGKAHSVINNHPPTLSFEHIKILDFFSLLLSFSSL